MGQAPLPRQRGRDLFPLPRSGSHSGCRQAMTTSGGGTGGLRITVVANPAGNQPSRYHHSSCAPKPVEVPMDCAGPSTRSITAVSLTLLLGDRMSTAASESEPELSGEEDWTALLLWQ